MITWQQGIWFK